MDIKESLLVLNKETQVSELLEMNSVVSKFGIVLTKEDASLLVNERINCLKEQQRIEFGEGIIKKLIFLFVDSPFIYQDNFVDTISRLQEIFYLYKNETMDFVADADLLSYMQEKFNGECQGSTEYLEETILANMSKYVRFTGK